MVTQTTPPTTYSLLDKGRDWEGTAACNAAFRKLELRFTLHPILCHFNQDLPTWIKSNASYYGIAAVLMQQQLEDKLWHPVAFISRTLSPAEKNYEVHDKQMLAIVFACVNWRPLLLSCALGFDALTDNV